MNKSLKFEPHLIQLIFNGRKRNTWRLFDDKNLTRGDIVDFLNSKTRERFATVTLTQVEEKAFANLDEQDWEGHEKYSSDEEMYKWFSQAYNQPVDSSTPVKVIWFQLNA